jgi:hypothetical protein
LNRSDPLKWLAAMRSHIPDRGEQMVQKSGQTRNRSNIFHYCIDGLYLATFWSFKFATNVTGNTTFA